MRKRRTRPSSDGGALAERQRLIYRKPAGEFAAALIVLAAFPLAPGFTPRAVAQQIVADGTIQTASGTINTGVLPPTAGYALYALNGGVIQSFSPLTLVTGGAGSHGAVAESGGSITIFAGSSVSANGNDATGLAATGAGSTITATNTVIDAPGSGSFGAGATNGSVITLNGGSVTSVNSALRVAAGGTINATGVNVTATGANAVGVNANGGTINLTGGSVTALAGSVDTGINASAGAMVNARDVSVNASGDGIRAVTRGTFIFENGTIASDAIGAHAGSNGTLHIANTTIISADNGLLAEAPGATITAANVNITTLDANATGVLANDATINLTGGSILTTLGPTAHGLQSTAGINGRINADGVTVSATGSGIFVGNGAQVDFRNGSITGGAHGVMAFASGQAGLTNTTIGTMEDDASGLFATDAGSLITAGNVTVATGGAAAHGMAVVNGGALTVTNSEVTATGPGASALFLSGSAGLTQMASVTDSTLTSTGAAAIDLRGGTAALTLMRTSVTGNGVWLSVASDAAPGVLDMTADASTLRGAAVTETGSVSNLTLRDNSIWNLTGNSNITNLINDPSLILFSPPAGAGFKTLTVVNYIGEGGIIGLHTFLGTDGSPSDKLVIDAGTASGLSGLRITNAGGPGAVTAGNGILVVDAVNGGTTEPGAFALARPAVAGPYEYTLHRSSVDTSNPEAWYLRSTIDCSLPDAPVPPCPGPGPGPNPPPVPPVPNIRPEVSLYTALPAMALFYGRTLLDTLHERVGEQEQLRAFANPGANPYANGAWGRIIAQHAERDSNSQGIFGTAGPQYDVDFTALQAGLDVYRRQQEDGSRNHAGLYGAFGRGDGDVTHLARIGAGTDTFDAWSVGGYWTWYAPMGAYIDTVLQGTWYDMTADPRRLPASDTDGFAVAASVEGGYPLQLGGGWVAEPQAQAIWQSLDLDETRDIGATIRFEDETSLAARIGLRLAKSWTAFSESGQPAFITAWFRPNLWYEFEGEPKTLFSSATGFIPFRADIGGSWLELNAGVSARVDAMVSLYANAGYDIGLSADGDAYNGKLGIRVNW